MFSLRPLADSARARLPWLLAAVAPLAAGGPATSAPQDPGPAREEARSTRQEEASESEIIERILILERRIEELSGLLSPAAREELERRLEEMRALEAASRVEPDAASAAPAAEPGRDEDPGVAPLEPAGELPAGSEGETAIELPEAATGRPAAAPETRARPPRCAPLLPLDTTGDGVLAATDRSWRFLAVWIDHDRDGNPDEREVQHPFELGIEELSLDLRSFRTRDDFTGDVRRGDRVYLEPLGRGSNTGVLMLDATRLRRGGGFALVGPEGEELDGLQALRPGLRLRDEAGADEPLDCP